MGLMPAAGIVEVASTISSIPRIYSLFRAHLAAQVRRAAISVVRIGFKSGQFWRRSKRDLSRSDGGRHIMAFVQTARFTSTRVANEPGRIGAMAGMITSQFVTRHRDRESERSAQLVLNRWRPGKKLLAKRPTSQTGVGSQSTTGPPIRGGISEICKGASADGAPHPGMASTAHSMFAEKLPFRAVKRGIQ